MGDWVANTVGLKQYKEAFLEFEYENLESIVGIDKQTFSQDIETLMETVDGKKEPAHRVRLVKFMKCYDALVAQYGTSIYSVCVFFFCSICGYFSFFYNVLSGMIVFPLFNYDVFVFFMITFI